MTARHVYVVDDEEPIRRSSELMLRVLGFAPRTFESGATFLGEAGELSTGCVLLDIRMPQMDGLEVQRRMNAHGRHHSVVVMSGHGDLGIAAQAFENGAVALLEKPFPRASLERALHIAFIRFEDNPAYRRYREAARQAVASLAPPDRAILALLARGTANESFAERLGLAPTEVEMARSRIFDRLDVDSTTEALRLAYAGGLATGA
jgi:two-component system response regulator FixJ